MNEKDFHMRILPVAALCTLFALPAFAQSLEWDDFDISLGGSGQYRADYLGSDDYEFGFAPRGEISWKKAVFVSTRNGAGIYVFNDPHFQMGAAIAPDFGRKEDTNSRLTGLGDIETGARLNIFADVWYAPFIAGAKANLGFNVGDADGQFFNFYAGLRKDLTERLTGQMTIGTTWANTDWNQLYYGVTAAQSASSGLAAYTPGDGFRDAALGGELTYRMTPDFNLIGSARWTHLMGDVADSPIVQDKDNLTLGLGLSYQLSTAKTGAGR